MPVTRSAGYSFSITFWVISADDKRFIFFEDSCHQPSADVMGGIVTGHLGNHAVKPVAVEYSSGADSASVQFQYSQATRVASKGHLYKLDTAIPHRVQVYKNYSFSISLNWWSETYIIYRTEMLGNVKWAYVVKWGPRCRVHKHALFPFLLACHDILYIAPSKTIEGYTWRGIYPIQSIYPIYPIQSRAYTISAEERGYQLAE